MPYCQINQEKHRIYQDNMSSKILVKKFIEVRFLMINLGFISYVN